MKNIIKKINDALLSPISQIIGLNISNTAGLGGFIIFLIIVGGVKMTSVEQVMTAIVAMPFALVVLTLSDYAKNRYLTKKTAKLTADKCELSAHIHALSDANKLKSAFPNTYQQIMSSLGNYPDTKSFVENQLSRCLIRNHHLQPSSYEYALRSTHTTLSTLTAIIGGISAIFVIFYVPITLKNELEEDKSIINVLIVSAACLALYNGLKSLAQSNKDWNSLQQERETLKQLIQSFIQLLDNSGEVIPQQVEPILSRWRITHPNETSGQQDAPVIRHTLA